VGKAEDKSAVCRIGRKQRWARYEALGEKENLSPARAWALILVDHYRSVALARPLLQGLAVISKPHGNPLDPLDVQDALGCFAPGARYIADTTMRTPLRSIASSTLTYENGTIAS